MVARRLGASQAAVAVGYSSKKDGTERTVAEMASDGDGSARLLRSLGDGCSASTQEPEHAEAKARFSARGDRLIQRMALRGSANYRVSVGRHTET